jgi:hypothetical protein
MTISNQTARTGPYNGNGSTTVFAYDFRILDQSHVVVTLKSAANVETVQTLTTNYTVSGVGDASGGNITMGVAPASGEQLTISRAVPQTQVVDLANRGAVAPEVLEGAYDKLTQLSQDKVELLNRMPRFPVSSSLTEVELPLTLTANTTLIVNAGATGYTNGPTASQISSAEADAAAAATSASAAATSESNAATSETNAANSETAAAASATSIGLTTRGDMLTRGASANARLAIGSANTVLTTNGTDPAWSTITNAMLAGSIDLTSKVTGALPLANGGTAATSASAARTALELAVNSWSGILLLPANQTYKLVIKCPFAGVIDSVTTMCASGTATATFKINTTALGGTANAISTSEQSQNHASDNAFSVGDDIQVTISSNSSCVDASFSIVYTR